MSFIQERVLFEDNHLIVVNKLCGELVQPAPSGGIALEDSIKTYLKEKYQKPGNVFLGVVHRIDRPVSGAVLFARTGKALARMNQMFKDRTVSKRYHVITRKKADGIPSNSLVHSLLRKGNMNKSIVVKPGTPESKEARLSYTHLATSDSFSLLEVILETGRHHQIRAQLSAVGLPILGDVKYGDKRPLNEGAIALHSYSLCFCHPVSNEEISIIAPYPSLHPWNLFVG